MKDNINRNYILTILETHGPTTISNIVTLLKVSRPAVYNHLEILEKEGLIKRTKDKTKKGGPVTITLLKKEIEKKRKRDVITFLKDLKDGKEIKEMRDLLKTNAYMDATWLGLITKKVYVTERGKKFLEENKSDKK